VNLAGWAEYIRTGYPPGDAVKQFAAAAMDRIATLERERDEARAAYCELRNA
jgi:predicted DNA-binding transcriptional regulator